MQTTGGKNSRKFTKCWLIWDVLRRVNYFSLSLGILIFLKSGSIVLAQSPLNQGTVVEIKRGQQRNISQMESDRTVAEKAFAEGEQLRDRGNKDSLQQAISKYQEALNLFKTLGDIQWQGATLNRLALTYNLLQDKSMALEAYKQELLIWRSLKNKNWEASILMSLGQIYQSLNENQQALDYYNQALILYKDFNNRESTANILNSLAEIYLKLGEKQKALEYFQQALSLFQELGFQNWIAIVLSQIGDIYTKDIFIYTKNINVVLVNPEKGLDYFLKAVPIHHVTEQKEWEAYSLTRIAKIYSYMGQNKKAVEYYEQALFIYRSFSNKQQQVSLIADICRDYHSLKEYQQAINCYNVILLLQRELKEKKREAETLKSIGDIYLYSGNKDKANKYFNEALLIIKIHFKPSEEMKMLHFIGYSYFKIDPKKAIEYFNRAFFICHSLKPACKGEGNTLFEIGAMYNYLGSKQKAIEYFQQALPLIHSYKNWEREAQILNAIGSYHFDLNELPQAVKYFKLSVESWEKSRNRSGKAIALFTLAKTYRHIGNFNEALKQIKNSIAINDILRSEITSPDERASYLGATWEYYDFYIDLLMLLHKNNPQVGHNIEALNISERGRARSLLELLNEAQADIQQGVDPTLKNQERQLKKQLTAKIQYQLQLLKNQPTNEEIIFLDKEIKRLQRIYQQLEYEIRAKNPRYAALTQPQPLTVKEIQQQVVDADSILLAYWLGEERSYLWAVTPTTINTYILPKRAEIQAAAKEFLDFLTVPSMRGTIKAKAATANLSQILLGQVASELGQKRLVIVGDGALQSIPFSALFVPNSNSTETAKPLFVDHEIVNLPSASTVALIRRDTKQRQPAPKAIAVIADPVFSPNDSRLKNQSATATHTPSLQQERLTRDLNRKPGEALFARLPGTRQEAEKILNLVQKSDRFQAFDFEASRQTATTSQLSQYQIVHFATHGFLNNQHPELSGIALSLVDRQGKPQDGLLLTPDIFNLNLPAELVVLSGCETGLGKEIRGEGIVGLTRGLMYAGASRVLVSLWSVQDTSTAELMTKFYQGMLEKGLTPAAALRAAQLQMWQQEDTQEPYYWASFILQGEWR